MLDGLGAVCVFMCDGGFSKLLFLGYQVDAVLSHSVVSLSNL